MDFLTLVFWHAHPPGAERAGRPNSRRPVADCPAVAMGTPATPAGRAQHPLILLSGLLKLRRIDNLAPHGAGPSPV